MSEENKGTLLITKKLMDQYISRVREICTRNDDCNEECKDLLLDFALEIVPPGVSVGIMKKIEGGK